jgi:hypothetical protein
MRDRFAEPPRDPESTSPPPSAVPVSMDGKKAQLRLEQELSTSAARGDLHGMAMALAGLASIADLEGDPEPARVLLEEAKSLWPQLETERVLDSSPRSDSAISTETGTTTNPAPDLTHR